MYESLLYILYLICKYVFIAHSYVHMGLLYFVDRPQIQMSQKLSLIQKEETNLLTFRMSKRGHIR